MIATLLSILMCCCVGLTIGNVDANKTNYLSNEIVEYCSSQAIEEGINSPKDEVYIVNDLNNNEFYIQTGETNGFMVYDPVVNNFIEKSASFESPYDFSKNGNYYYFGPMNYYERVSDLFYSLISEKCSPNSYKVALAIAPGVDYHWYRQNSDGTWSHKLASNPSQNCDASNGLIYDPQYCNSNYSSANYKQFCGFYEVDISQINI